MMTLEEQLAQLAKIGLPLNQGITVEDLLLYDQRKDFEETPFDLIVWVLGGQVQGEPWGRHICSQAWHFDCECVQRPDIYTDLVTRLCEAAGFPEHIKDIRSFFDMEAEEGWLKYTANGIEQYYDLDVNDDWVDGLDEPY